MKQVLLLIFVFMISFTLKAQIKPTAMLLPIYFVDLDKKSLQGSLNNFVKTELSNYYDLKSEKEVEQARDAAVDQISSENCTEEACVKVMGELLDVEYTFSLEIIDTGEGWDLSVVRQDMDRVTSRRNELCNECSLSKARKSLAGILTALRPGEMLIQRGKASLRLESTPRSQVFLDGREQGKTPLDLSVNARVPLEIFMVAEGYNDFAEEFTLKPGEKRKKHAKLTRKRGNIRITSNPPKASIYVDGILEMDDQDKDLLTPADLRLVYGQHELKLQLEKYEVATKTLRINKKNLGTKNITLKPKPGRLIVRVPSEFKDALIIINGREIGEMGGKIAKVFEVNANVSLEVQVKQGDFEGDVEIVEVGPEKIRKVEFNKFSDLRLVELKKQEELRDRQDSLEAEKKRKEQFEKIRKLFKNTRVEIRTFGRFIDSEAYALYFYFDPRFAIGYIKGNQNNESNLASTCYNDCSHEPLKYRIEAKGYVMRIRYSNFILFRGIQKQSSPRYMVDSWGLSLFSASGKLTGQTYGRSSKIKPSGMTIDYVWYWENGISLLFGLGYTAYNAEEDWSNNWENFEETSLFSWGLLNIGYMF
jgi:hypothetical protein